MKARVIAVMLLLLALSLALFAQNAQELYQRGLAQEHSNGNLSEAIHWYSQAAKAASKDRALAAKALIRIATCEEKLGRATDAADTYASVLRDYPEQRSEGATAQERLNYLRRKSSVNARNVSATMAPIFESYCVNCHSSANRAGGLDLNSLRSGNVGENTSTWELVLRRLRARRDPPANLPRPDDKGYRSAISNLEQALDATYSTNHTSTPAERVTDAEWATRIAGLIWGGVPDASLIEDAQKGRLREDAVLNRQVSRMLRDPRSTSLIANFLEPWLSLDKVSSAAIEADLRQSMQTEARLFLESQIREDRPVLELWTANYTFVNERLARHYGVGGVSGNGFQRLTWRDTNRAGILGMSALLTGLSSSPRTSPTMRGLYVLTKFLGIDPAPPPANVPPLPETAAARERPMRDRMVEHKANPSCANCHGGFDPMGLALENFDSLGQWRSFGWRRADRRIRCICRRNAIQQVLLNFVQAW
jgi:mono/diheme cytochrome c family protein